MVTLDILRGVALLGILLVNMEAFSSVAQSFRYAGLDPYTNPLDRLVAQAITFFAQGKFISMFTFLFGLGLVLQAGRAREGGGGATLLLRRLAVLLVFGLVHGLFIWRGDILATYAVVGLPALLLLRLPPRWLLLGAFFLHGLSVGTLLLSPPLLPGGLDASALLQVEANPPGDPARRERLLERASAIYGRGSLQQIQEQRAQEFRSTFGAGLAFAPWLLGTMLLGMWAGRVRLFEQPQRFKRLLMVLTVLGLALGGGASALMAFAEARLPQLDALRLLAYTVAGPTMMLGYLAALTLLLQRSSWQRGLWRWGAVGRMALSNYLLQSVLATLVFYSYGLGLYGRVGPGIGLTVSLAIFSLQLLLSPLWLRYFRFGPAEWLWRSLSYGNRQPFRHPLR